MKHARPLLLAASALVLFITACSQPADIQASVLEPQFGSAAGDIGIDVAVTSAGGVYTFAQQSAQVEWEGTDYSLQLRRYDSRGKLVWNRQVDTRACSEWDSNCIGLFAKAVEVDANGFVYAVATYEGSPTTMPTASAITSISSTPTAPS
jgi:hypothetical protein